MLQNLKDDLDTPAYFVCITYLHTTAAVERLAGAGVGSERRLIRRNGRPPSSAKQAGWITPNNRCTPTKRPELRSCTQGGTDNRASASRIRVLQYLERLAGAGVRSEHGRGLGQMLVGDPVHVVEPHVAQGLRDAPTLVVLELNGKGWERVTG